MNLSPEAVRRLSHAEIGLALADDAEAEGADADAREPAIELPALDGNHPLVLTVEALRADGFAGVILSGQPGTSKSYFARRLAATLCQRDPDRIAFVQFHPSYQYEDFMESYEPTASGGFTPKPRIFLEMCELASASQLLHVLVIDELSRSDAVRVFGEALTYLEASQRGIQFELASGRPAAIPKNLFILATMNPWDRGVDELDMAFERRFAKIALDPSETELRSILEENGLPADVQERIVLFFRRVQGLKVEHAKIGHAYFARVKDIDGLKRLWDHQLSHHFKRAFRLVPEEYAALSTAWVQVVQPPAAPAAA